MLRVFLVIDDYNELIYLQTLLRKLGFDVESLQNQRKYADVSLGFNPQILVVTSFGKKVDGVMLAQSINKRRGIPKIIALRTDNTYTSQDFEMSGVDLVLDSPVNPVKLIVGLATLGGIEENQLIEKYNKIKASMDQNGVIVEESGHIKFDDNGQPIDDVRKVRSFIDSAVNTKTAVTVKTEVTGKTAAAEPVANRNELPSISTNIDPGRQARFDKWKQEVGPLKNQNFNRDRIREFNKKLRSKPLSEDYSEIEEDKKAFVKALYNQK